jgi:signal transduction histidine kinase
MRFWAAIFALATVAVSVSGCRSAADGAARAPVSGPFTYRFGDRGDWQQSPDLASIPSSGGTRLTIRVELPPVGGRDPTLFVSQVYLTFDAYVDGVRIGGFDHADPGGRAWHLLPLPAPFEGGTLELRVRSDYSKIGVRGPLYLGGPAAHVAALVVEDTPRLVLALLFFFVAVAALVLAVRGSERLAAGGFAAWALSLAMWTLFYTRARDLYLPDPTVWLLVWGLGLAIAGPAALVFFTALFGRDSRLLRGTIAVNLASSAIGLVLLVARPDESISNPFLVAHRAVLGASYLVVGYVLVQRIRAGSRDAVIYGAGFALHLLFGLHDVLLGLGLIGARDTVTHWGMLVFLVSGGWVLQRRLAALRDRVAEQAVALAVHAREREMMLRDLHDGLGRITTGITMLTEVARREHDGAPLARIAELAHAGTDEIRTFMQGLDEDGCDWAALEARMRHQASGVIEPQGGSFELRAAVASDAEPPSPYLYIQLLRVFQEGITNAIKHAAAPRVRARLDVTGSEVVLGVDNDGIGAGGAGAGINAGAGLANMKARAADLGGSLEFERADDAARLLLRVPVPIRYSAAPAP